MLCITHEGSFGFSAMKQGTIEKLFAEGKRLYPSHVRRIRKRIECLEAELKRLRSWLEKSDDELAK